LSDAPQHGLSRRISAELESLRAQSQFRSLEILGGVNLSSNDYLGLATDSRLKQAVAEAVEHSPALASTGSRLLSGNSADWENLENYFADYVGTEAALYFGSGYSANVGLLSSIAKPGDVVFSDALNHASLIDGVRLSGAAKVIYPHGDLPFLERALREHAGASGAKIIVTESIFSMEGDVAPVQELIRLAHDHGAELMLDEAHAIGVRGPEGRGIAAELGCEREIFARIFTCGKALASAGAFVCGSADLKNYLINRARSFIFSTALPPYFAQQIRAAVDLARASDDRREHLHAIGSALRADLAAENLSYAESTTQIIPVILGSNDAALFVAAQLRDSGFAIKAIRPPTVPPGTARLRISLTSKITLSDVQQLSAAIAAAMKSLQHVSSSAPVHA
jgi:8-amino-7-oxononanoate synthase